MKLKLIILLLFSLPNFAQNLRVSHELNNMFVGAKVATKNDKFSPAISSLWVYWHGGYSLNFEKPVGNINNKELSIGAGIGVGIMPVAMIGNFFLSIIGDDDKINVFSVNHNFTVNYAKNNWLSLRAGYQAVYFDISDYDFIDKYNYGFFVGGKANVGGRTYLGLDLNAQRFRHKDQINFTNIPQTQYLYGFNLRAGMYFK